MSVVRMTPQTNAGAEELKRTPSHSPSRSLHASGEHFAASLPGFVSSSESHSTLNSVESNHSSQTYEVNGEHYRRGAKIGEGTFKEVYDLISIATGQSGRYVLKTQKKQNGIYPRTDKMEKDAEGSEKYLGYGAFYHSNHDPNAPQEVVAAKAPGRPLSGYRYKSNEEFFAIQIAVFKALAEIHKVDLHKNADVQGDVSPNNVFIEELENGEFLARFVDYDRIREVGEPVDLETLHDEKAPALDQQWARWRVSKFQCNSKPVKANLSLDVLSWLWWIYQSMGEGSKIIGLKGQVQVLLESKITLTADEVVDLILLPHAALNHFVQHPEELLDPELIPRICKERFEHFKKVMTHFSEILHFKLEHRGKILNCLGDEFFDELFKRDAAGIRGFLKPYEENPSAFADLLETFPAAQKFIQHLNLNDAQLEKFVKAIHQSKFRNLATTQKFINDDCCENPLLGRRMILLFNRVVYKKAIEEKIQIEEKVNSASCVGTCFAGLFGSTYQKKLNYSRALDASAADLMDAKKPAPSKEVFTAGVSSKKLKTMMGIVYDTSIRLRR